MTTATMLYIYRFFFYFDKNKMLCGVTNTFLYKTKPIFHTKRGFKNVSKRSLKVFQRILKITSKRKPRPYWTENKIKMKNTKFINQAKLNQLAHRKENLRVLWHCHKIKQLKPDFFMLLHKTLKQSADQSIERKTRTNSSMNVNEARNWLEHQQRTRPLDSTECVCWNNSIFFTLQFSRQPCGSLTGP